MISRDEALILIRKYIKTENTIKHMLATEAIMRALAKKLEPENEEAWGLAGLIHDLDYEVAKNPEIEHGLKIFELLKQEGVELGEAIEKTIKAHVYNYHPEWAPSNKMEWALFICDSLTGLIVATTLVRPDKKLVTVEVKSIMKKFKQSAFAAGTRREEIAMCEEKLGIPLLEFVDLSLKAMQAISSDLGL